ncbi:glutathione S-transferase family protein [Gymnodinialimonas sp. 2305UL16-5]|uniref:glutathione S-transferase family protein n=1 Tax=Gymnodinialimonas mytili TaxID=3126503 RepID=UPI0030B2BEFB
MKFYFHTTPNPFKTALMLEELGLDYETIPVDTRKGEQHKDAFRAVNPNGKVPAITEDDGTHIFDSNAIVLYLAQKHGQFLPEEKDMGETLSWFFWIATGLSPFSGQAVHFTRAHTESAYATRRYTREIARHYALLNERLEGRDWIAGDAYGICDIAAWGWVKMAPFVMEAEGGLSPYPNVAAWFERVNARPAVARVDELAQQHTFKQEMDEEAMRAMFPQNF